MTKDPYEPLVGSVDALAKYVMWAVAVALPALLAIRAIVRIAAD
jgi:hypothetical protein